MHPNRKISLFSIQANSKNRLDGYIDEVMKRGTVDGDFITLSEEDFQYIRNNFSKKDTVEIRLPKITTMAKTAITSTANWISNGAKKVSDEVIQERLLACKGCEFWNSGAFNNTGRCMKCGCSTWVKLRMDTEKCPIGKW
jgi:hypothetical protein